MTFVTRREHPANLQEVKMIRQAPQPETTSILGYDIGGSKIAVVLGTLEGSILEYQEFPTPALEPFEVSFDLMKDAANDLLTAARQKGLPEPKLVSAAVGGPLDIERGIIHSPPHLPTWTGIHIKDRLEDHFQLPVYIEHDGNACALAEFYLGAGRGAKNVIYLTLGTGLGAGIILNGKIYRGSSDLAGEVGHIRIAPDGPLEHGKAGSWEGFCSASGMLKLAHLRFPGFWHAETKPRQIMEQALHGVPKAVALVEEMGTWLGKGCALLVDILNPEIIIAGTLGGVLGDLLLEPARRVVQAEALPQTAQVCQIIPAQLGSQLGKISALAAAMDAYNSSGQSFPAAR
jgi:glucokinase